MSCIDTNSFGAAEKCSADNWAAEYAKKLSDKESSARINKDAEHDGRLDSLNAAVGDTETLTTNEKGSLVGAVNEMNNRFESEITALDLKLENSNAALSAELENNSAALSAELENSSAALSAELDTKVAKTDYASTERAGIIKLRTNGSGANQSGLLADSSTGALAVGVPTDESSGIRRDSTGMIRLCHATADEVKSGTNSVKPVTPSALSALTGKLNELETTNKTSLGAAVNEVKSSVDNLKEYVDDKYRTALGNMTAIEERHLYDEDILRESAALNVLTTCIPDNCRIYRAFFTRYPYPSSNLSNNSYSVTDVLANYVNDVTHAFVINGFAALQCGSSPCAVDDYIGIMSGQNWDFSGKGSTGYDGIYGWIEFASLPDNIKTSDTSSESENGNA